MSQESDATGHPGESEGSVGDVAVATIARRPEINPISVVTELTRMMAGADEHGLIWRPKAAPTEGEASAYNQGYVDGVHAGHEVGYRAGAQGFTDARAEGYRAGYNDRGNDQARLDGLAAEVLQSATRCHRHDAPKGACVELATHRYTWPGQTEESFACAGHAESVREVAEIIGLDLEIFPL